jgi:hypothetical protein
VSLEQEGGRVKVFIEEDHDWDSTEFPEFRFTLIRPGEPYYEFYENELKHWPKGRPWVRVVEMKDTDADRFAAIQEAYNRAQERLGQIFRGEV